MAQNPPGNQAEKSSKPLINKSVKKQIIKNKNYTPIPNDLILALANGIVGSYCFKLILHCLSHSEDFHLWRKTLLKYFSNNERTLSDGQREAIARKMIRIEKHQKENRYIILDMTQWDISTLKENLSHTDNSQADNSQADNSQADNSQAIIRKDLNKEEFNPPKKKCVNKEGVEGTHTQDEYLEVGHIEIDHFDQKEASMSTEYAFLQSLAETIHQKLKDEWQLHSQIGLIRHYLAISQQANPRSETWYRDHIEEMVGWCVAQKNPMRDPGVSLHSWLKHYREPSKPKEHNKGWQNGRKADMEMTPLREDEERCNFNDWYK